MLHHPARLNQSQFREFTSTGIYNCIISLKSATRYSSLEQLFHEIDILLPNLMDKAAQNVQGLKLEMILEILSLYKDDNSNICKNAIDILYQRAINFEQGKYDRKCAKLILDYLVARRCNDEKLVVKFMKYAQN
eukprot:TRINITY_DN18259_c0_g1_i1.p3 TRINITY_DN18259_c0_g1~~TRINITY_DN18259_c0_g1_i1.p3  ORF type:complete len:134 (-),score=7.39 TRINITY_DN18259_c0_g1_i1:24-425(-)